MSKREVIVSSAQLARERQEQEKRSYCVECHKKAYSHETRSFRSKLILRKQYDVYKCDCGSQWKYATGSFFLAGEAFTLLLALFVISQGCNFVYFVDEVLNSAGNASLTMSILSGGYGILGVVAVLGLFLSI